MIKPDGGPAFPRAIPKGEWPIDQAIEIIERHAGMTLRDFFAAAALPSLISYTQPAFSRITDNDVAAAAYRYADAMLRERDK